MALPRAWMLGAVAALLTVFAASAQAAADHVWVVDSNDNCASSADTGAVYMANASTHAITLLSSGGFLRKPMGVAASPDGGTVWVTDANAFDSTPPAGGGCDDGTGGVIAINTATGEQTPVSGSGTGSWNDPHGIAYDPAHGTLIVTDIASGTGQADVWSVNPTTGAQTLIAFGNGMVQPEGVAVASDGTVYVADPAANSNSGAIWKIVQTGGSPDPPVMVATGPDMAEPEDLTWMTNGHLMVLDTLVGEGSAGLLDVLPDAAAPGSASHQVGPTPTSPPTFCGAGITLSPFTSPRGIVAASSGTDFYVSDGAADPMWCPDHQAVPVLFGADSTAAASWVAGLDSATPWVTPRGVTLATKNRLPVPVIGVPADGTTGQALTVDGSHSIDPDGDALTYRFDLDGNGTFETPGDANGKASALFTVPGDYPVGVQVDDGNGGTTSTGTMLRVVAAPSLPVDPPAQTPAPPGAQNPPVIVETTTPKTPGTVTFQQLLSPNGIVVPLTCTADCTVDAILQILLKDYKNLTAANKLITIGKGSIKLTAGKKGKLRIKLTKQARKKLKIALAAAHISVKRKIKLNLVLQSKYKSGKKKTIRRKIILKG